LPPTFRAIPTLFCVIHLGACVLRLRDENE